MNTVHLTLYGLRNLQGKYMAKLNRKGWTWVDDLKIARIYVKPGPARSQITWYANHYPEDGIPELIELRVTEVVAINEDSRVNNSISRKEKATAKHKKMYAENMRRCAEIKLKEAQETLDRLKEQVL